jgi:hypothetical protein
VRRFRAIIPLVLTAVAVAVYEGEFEGHKLVERDWLTSNSGVRFNP